MTPQVQSAPGTVSAVPPTGCCPPFDPRAFEDKTITWQDKLFARAHVHSLFHIPLDMGRKIVAAREKILAAGAAPAQQLMLVDERSPWGSELYIDIAKPVPGLVTETMSGTFMTKVFEGPFRDAPKWAAAMRQFVAAKGLPLTRLYFAYTTCPACAKAYGKNYVVLFAKVD